MTTTAGLGQDLEHLVYMATCAPSVHNTQPWRFIETATGLDLVRDESRRLDVIDPWGRELLMSCGAALDHLAVAARAIGMSSSITVGVDGQHVAHVELSPGPAAIADEIDLAVAILNRHTHRGRFAGPPISPAESALLTRAVEVHSGLLRVVAASELVELEVLLSRAEDTLLSSVDYRNELQRWVWSGDPDIDPHVDRADGLPPAATDHGPDRAESLIGREFDGRPLARPSEPPEPEQQTVVLLSSLGDTAPDWVESGRALSALLLRATLSGIAAQPLGQVLDLPGPRRQLIELLGTVGSPQLLLRLGHGSTGPSTPRRPVAEVLDTLAGSSNAEHTPAEGANHV